MSERKVCLYTGVGMVACERSVPRVYWVDLTVADDVARLYVFRHLPRRAQCDSCADSDVVRGEQWYASRADILSVAIFCGALAGAIPPDVRDVIADYIAHDRLGQADPSPLLDLAEQRGLHEGGYGPERYEEWAEAMEHVHVWLPYTPTEMGPRETPVALLGPPTHRCPCGRFENEWLRGEHDTIEMRARYWGSVVTQPWPWPRGPFDI